MPAFTRRAVKTVAFPSGAVLDTGSQDSNLCASCHQGRESTVSVNAKITGLDLDTVSTKLSFTNVHYFAAGATLFGTQAKGAYEYAGKTYLGRLTHVSSFDACTECHEAHTGEVKTQGCSSPICHGNATPRNIRKDARDFDGNGNKSWGLYYEVAGAANILYATIQNYATNVAKSPDRLRPDDESVLLQGYQRQRQAGSGRGRQCQQVRELDAETAVCRLQLPILPEGPRRLCP